MSRQASSRLLVTRLVAVVTVAAAVASVVLVRAWLQQPDDTALAAGAGRTAYTGGHVTRDLDGTPVVWDAAPDVARAGALATGGRFVAPRQQVSVPLLSASVVGGVIVPPTLTDAYVIRDFGRLDDTTTGLVVVAMHSVRGGRGPGNALFEPGSGRTPHVSVGDRLAVDETDYRVTAVLIEPKGAAATDPRVWGRWRERGDELAVITCLLDPHVPMTRQDNLVVLARRT
ncbi:hypothetical protein LJR027_001820 [Terrabacter sp. LjRoot27]|uniref:hypothetical protein n=1 Tax=Terrabacter sp. LjRoot27 TaxID=3342306 RepID=UPI003ECE31B8